MLVLNCPKDFHDKYYPYSTNQVIQGIPYLKKKEKLFEEDDKKNIIKNNINENINGEIKGTLENNKKDSEINDNNKNPFQSKKSNIHRVNESTIVENENEKINIVKSMNKYDNEEVTIETIMKNEEDTKNNIKFIMRLFSKLNLGYDKLIDTILKIYSEKIANKIKSENKNYYEKGIEYLCYKYNTKKFKIYYEIQYEDIIFLLSSIIKYFTHLNVKLELGEEDKNLMIIFYGNENIYDYLADITNYELQLKPYAYKYVLFEKEFETKLNDMKTLGGFHDENNNKLKDNDNDTDSESSQILSVNDESYYIPIQFEDLKDSIPYNYPPYKIYDKEKSIKYRRYEKNDLYHECQNIPLDKEINCKYCSKFRNIDKLRLITISLDKLISLNYLKKQKVLIMNLFQRNYKSYGEMINIKNIYKNSWNIFSNKDGRYLVNLIRNFFGEHISYYYLYLNDYIKWLVIPSILGILVEFLIKFLPDFIEPKPLGKTPITYIDIIGLIFCIIINIWIGLFLQSWKQREKLYAYFWGTEYYTRSEPDREDFKPDLQKEFVFGEKLKFIKPSKRRLKQFISYCVLFCMMALTCSITFGLLNLKQRYLIKSDEIDNSLGKTNKNDVITTPKTFWHDTLISILFAAINAIQIKIFNTIYTIIAKKLNEWENYQKDYQSIRDLTIKLVLFEFMNNYSACFYIGFIKPNIGKKCAGTCMHEMEIQLYTTYAIFFALNAIELGIPFIFYKYRSYEYKKSIKNFVKEKFPNLNEKETKEKIDFYTDIQPQSSLHQLLVEEADNMIYEYTEVIILFGFVCLFSVSAPLTPLIILLLIWTEKLVDLLKMFYFERFESLDKENGIGIYNFLMKVLIFFGQLTNIGVVLFSKSFRLDNDLYYKVVIFLFIENGLLIIGFLVSINILPNWFEYLTDLKELYTLKYFRRKDENLPHLKFLDNKIIDKNDIDNTQRKISQEDII